MRLLCSAAGDGQHQNPSGVTAIGTVRGEPLLGLDPSIAPSVRAARTPTIHIRFLGKKNLLGPAKRARGLQDQRAEDMGALNEREKMAKRNPISPRIYLQPTEWLSEQSSEGRTPASGYLLLDRQRHACHCQHHQGTEESAGANGTAALLVPDYARTETDGWLAHEKISHLRLGDRPSLPLPASLTEDSTRAESETPPSPAVCSAAAACALASFVHSAATTLGTFRWPAGW